MTPEEVDKFCPLCGHFLSPKWTNFVHKVDKYLTLKADKILKSGQNGVGDRIMKRTSVAFEQRGVNLFGENASDNLSTT